MAKAKHSERYLEKVFREKAADLGFLSYKVSSIHNRGFPDRYLLANKKTILVELKTNVGKLTKLQVHVHKLIKYHGGSVVTLYGKEEIIEFLESLSKTPS